MDTDIHPSPLARSLATRVCTQPGVRGHIVLWSLATAGRASCCCCCCCCGSAPLKARCSSERASERACLVQTSPAATSYSATVVRPTNFARKQLGRTRVNVPLAEPLCRYPSDATRRRFRLRARAAQPTMHLSSSLEGGRNCAVYLHWLALRKSEFNVGPFP